MTRGYRPETLDEAVRVLGDERHAAVPVAGCTDLMVVDETADRTHAAVVDLLRLPELQGIFVDEDTLDIGAACTFTAIRRHPLVNDTLPVLAEVAATIGGWQIQNRATLGGNIANASPAGDSLPVLLALDAQLVLTGPNGSRVIPYDEMHTGYRQTALRPGELIVRIRVPLPRDGAVHTFKKIGTREAQAISKVVVAFAARKEDGVLHDVRLAAGSVAPTPIRLKAAEAACAGRVPDHATADTAAAAAADEVTPIDDVRSTARYRSHALSRVVRRMVLGA